MRNIFVLIFLASIPFNGANAQKASIRVENMRMKTYMFSDPDPVANPGRIYPYFRFDGYTAKGIQKEWKMVILENDYIKVFVCPDIGGKVWGAIEKSTGKEFLYYNHVVKFRDVAMRGPWTSGGLEYNFGDIGHIPTCATPVDYSIKENDDGSVSCTVGAIDLPSRTRWNVEITLQKDQAFFRTRASWFNLTSLPNTYYHWMNAAARASGNLHFIYPGDHYIGHGGEPGTWPIENKRDLSWYENNDFGPYKSYHVINSYSNFFGGYWMDDNFGFGHLASYDDKPGKKLWIWGLSRQGMIWEDLLTDNDGQYIEFQAGKLFNQAAYSSTFTPFKHKEFPPYDSDIMMETWFPLVGTGGMVAASEYAVMNMERKGNMVLVKISALQNLADKLTVYSGNKIITTKQIDLDPLQLDSLKFEVPGNQDFLIELGNSKLKYSSSVKDRKVDRPIEPNKDFDWNSAYGWYIKGLEQEKQRMYNAAMESYNQCLEKEKAFAPAINRKSLLLYMKMEYDEAKQLALTSLSIDTYDPEANYVYGLACIITGEITNAKSGFSIAAASVKYRTAAYTELARIFLQEDNFPEALNYANKALAYNVWNLAAYEIQAIAYRETGKKEKAFKILDKLTELDPTLHFSFFEKYLWDEAAKSDFMASIYNELPVETYLELAMFYYDLGSNEDALKLLKMAPENPVVSLWLAKIDQENKTEHLNNALSLRIDMVFPYRSETADILEQFTQTNQSWKLKYYLGLIYWNKGMPGKAKNLFRECGNDPDAVPFWLAKAKLFSDQPEIVFESLNKARELDKHNWRAALALIKYDLKNSRAENALPLAKEFAIKHPENPYLGLSYVESMIQTGQYKKSIQFLQKYNILPFEGGTIGRDMYHEACIREALNYLEKKKYNSVIKYAKMAGEWPENLGVGRPFDTDERLERFLVAKALDKSGKKTEAGIIFEQLADYKRPVRGNENSKLIFQLMALKQLNREKEARELLKTSLDEFPGNPYLKWVSSAFLQDGEQGKIKNKILGEKTDINPYDISFTDKEFELVTQVVSRL